MVRSPDTDVFILLLAYSGDVRMPVWFETGTGNRRRIVDVNTVVSTYGNDVAKALPGLHAFTGCDTTSAFVCRRKKKAPFKLMASVPGFVKIFQQLGTAPDCLTSDMTKALEHFVCCMYGYPQLRETHKVCSTIFQSRYRVPSPQSLSTTKRVGIDLGLLPPCTSTLRKHCMRANYQTLIWKKAHIPYPSLPKPEGHGWRRDRDGRLVIDWLEGDMMPHTVADIVADFTTDDGELLTMVEVTNEDDKADNVIDVLFTDDEDCEDCGDTL